MLKKIPAILFALILLAGGAAQADMTKAEVEKIVENYIMNNAETILKSVDAYQRKTMEDRQNTAIQNNKENLFNDDRSPFIGNENGDVVVVEFFDYNCGYCKKAFVDLKAVADADKNVKIVFKDFPILGPTSETASKWALAAQKQNKYFEFHQALMQHHGAITDEALEKMAKNLGLDVGQMKAAVEGTEVLIQIEKNRALATQMGLGGTPAFIIGEELLPGAVPKSVLEEKIAAARKAKAKPEEKKAE